MIRKMFAVLLLVLFTISVVPLALAQVDADTMETMDDGTEQTEFEEGDGFGEEERRHRPGVQARNEEMRENFKDMKDDFKDGMRDARDEFKEGAREKAGEFKDELKDEFKAKRREMQEEFRERHHDFMENAKERMHQYFEENDVSEDVREKYKARFEEKKGEFKDNHEHFENIKERSAEAKDKYREHQGELKDLRKQARDCDTESEDCSVQQAALKEGAKEHLLRTLSVMDKPLEKYTNRIDGAEHLSDAQKEAAHAAAADIQTDIDAARDVVEALGEDSTAEEYKTATEEVKELWKNIRKKFKSMVGALSLSKSANVIDKQQEAYEGMQERIAELQAEGTDTTELEALQEKYESQLDMLREQQTEADAAWQAGVAAGDLADYRTAQKEVHDEAKESHATLREFMQTYRDVSTS